MEVPDARYRELARQIASDESPVGIDAKKTHVMILYLLEDIVRRLDSVERRLAELED